MVDFGRKRILDCDKKIKISDFPAPFCMQFKKFKVLRKTQIYITIQSWNMFVCFLIFSGISFVKIKPHDNILFCEWMHFDSENEWHRAENKMVFWDQTNRHDQVELTRFLIKYTWQNANFLLKKYKTRTRAQVKNELDDLIKHVVAEFYQPEINNLKARTTWSSHLFYRKFIFLNTILFIAFKILFIVF